MLGDPSVFSWAQAFSDRAGKTSITSILAAITVSGGMLIFVSSSIAALFNLTNAITICTNSLAVLTLGASLAGVNKVMGGKPITEDTVVDMTESDKKDSSDVNNL